MHFPHDGIIVTIEQLSFVGHDLTTNHLTSSNVLNMQMVSPLPQFNYMETYPMPTPINEEETFTICSTYFHLDLVGDMVNHKLKALEPDLSI